MKDYKALIWRVGLGMFLAGAAQAQVPALINFQGKLLDAAHNPRNGSNFNLTFRIFDAPSDGTLLWSETQNDRSVSNGVFGVQLGAVNPLPPSVFSSGAVYLEVAVQIGAGALEVGNPRQQLVTSPYSFLSQSALNLASGATNYVQVTGDLQTGATFYVSSATVSGPFAVGGVITAGSGAHAITTPTGLLDATKLSGALPSAQLSGTYSNAITLSNTGNSLAGDGAKLTNLTAAHLLPGDTNYVQNRATLQAGATFYVSSGTVGGTFVATGTVTLGGAAGVNDVTVRSNLAVNGDIRVNGNDLQDAGGTNRITLGDTNLINGNLGVPSGARLYVSTSVFLNGTANMDNFIAFPFTASTAINPGDVVIISGANTVGTVAVNGNVNTIGFAATGASSGQTVWVATSGIITNATSGAAINVGAALCTSSSGAGRVYTCAGNVGDYAPVGKALSGTSAAGQTLSVIIFNGK
jgi:hypothetical protein